MGLGYSGGGFSTRLVKPMCADAILLVLIRPEKMVFSDLFFCPLGVERWL